MFYSDPRINQSSQSFPPNIYTLAPQKVSYTYLPVDKDPFVALSVNLFEKHIYDGSMMMLETAIKNQASNFSVKARSTDGLTITIQPFICVLYSGMTLKMYRQDVPITISAANLVPSGSFAANTRYYVYANLNGTTTSVIISTGVPHIYLLYKDNAGAQDTTNKFLFSFLTDAASKIISFYKNGHDVYFLGNPTGSHVLVDGNQQMYTAVNLGTLVPSHSSIILVKCNIYNGENMGACAMHLQIHGLPTDGRLAASQIDGTLTPISPYDTTFHIPNDSTLKYRVDFAGTMATPTKANMYIIGYME